MSKHGEPWKAIKHPRSACGSFVRVEANNKREVFYTCTESDGNRAIACVNACEGIKDPSAITELVAAAENITGMCGECGKTIYNDSETCFNCITEATGNIKAALDKAKGGG